MLTTSSFLTLGQARLPGGLRLAHMRMPGTGCPVPDGAVIGRWNLLREDFRAAGASRRHRAKEREDRRARTCRAPDGPHRAECIPTEPGGQLLPTVRRHDRS